MACGKTAQGQWQKYLLGPDAVDGRDVEQAKAVFNTQTAAGWAVQVHFTAEGTREFAEITGRLARNQSPQNQSLQNEFAVVLDGEVISDPYVSRALTGGTVEVSGGLTRDEAQDLAGLIASGSLPVTLKITGTVSPHGG
ncbi:SecDF P1 head subdomain-containing protein [Streptomyces sp. CA-249302]|uniref:SecDF P1 head subdomain-containing protein n=1 Tax=Streptomyces sp. CA-249302 TaxID=3240058 RepID=UPI003D8D63A9